MPLYITDTAGNTAVVTPGASGLNTSGGSGDKSYTHTQSLAATTWTVNHNLGKFPSITIVDSAGTHVLGTIVQISLNTVTVSFSVAFSGKVYCN